MDKEARFIAALKRTGACVGIGDDGVEIAPYKNLITASDAFFERVHFRRSWGSLDALAHKAFAANISDILAMNARPKYALLTVSLPRDFTHISELASALGRAACAHGVKIIGGDTIAGARLDFSLTIFGEANGRILRRSGARRGDILGYITPFWGQRFGRNGWVLKFALRFNRAPKNSRFITPKLNTKMTLALNGLARAGMDISDGLFCDIARLCEQSCVGVRFKRGFTQSAAFFSPEEYQMLYALAPRNLRAMQARARRFRHRFVPFGIAVRGRYRQRTKGWH